MYQFLDGLFGYLRYDTVALFLCTMPKASAIAPTNIAFIKYMGKDPRGAALPNGQGLNFPENGSISMCLDGLHSHTTVEFGDFSDDIFVLDGKRDTKESARTFALVDHIRKMAGMSQKARVESRNNFGKSRGLSSSASGFAALSAAGAAAAGLTLSVEELSALARKGSGSASRSIPDGFVEWSPPLFDASGTLIKDSTAVSIFPSDHWDIADVIVVTTTPAKEVSTTQAHGKVSASPYRDVRLARMPKKLEDCRQYLTDKNFTAIGRLLEEESWDLHILFISSGVRYLRPETLHIMDEIERGRKDLEAYYTLNTGQDIHIICRQKDAEALKKKMLMLDCVEDVIINKPGLGTRLTDKHLF